MRLMKLWSWQKENLPSIGHSIRTALAATLLAPVSAHAHPLYHYTGGCAIAGPVGAGPGIPYVAVVATYSDGTPAPTAPITATCALYRGSVAQGVIAGPASGFGTAAATGSPTWRTRPLASTVASRSWLWLKEI